MLKKLAFTLCIAIVCTMVWMAVSQGANSSMANVSQKIVAKSYKDPYTPFGSYIHHKRAKRLDGYAKVDQPEMYAQIAKELRTPNDLNAPAYSPNYKMEAIESAQKQRSETAASRGAYDLNFIERGPINIAGRTRALLTLPTDTTNNTWIAGSASGGIWRTEDAGAHWTNLTPELPSLGTNTLAMSAADPNVIYAGTGEVFTKDIDGVGLFKSTDQGDTWTQIVRPGDYDAFRTINRIAVDPQDPDHVVVLTRNSVFEDSLRSAIYKTYDGGVTWQQTRFSLEERYDDIVVNPENFHTQYVAINRTGVIKSSDAGESWTLKSAGLRVTGRIELAISPVDTSTLWASAQGVQVDTDTDVYLTRDGAEAWDAVSDPTPIDYLGGQGWYDNTIQAHPFDRDIAYVGGVNLFKIKASSKADTTTISAVRDRGVLDFIEIINGARVDGDGGIYPSDNYTIDERVSVELRFGVSQKAHRFTVDKRGAVVPDKDYMYQDYVDIPFQVWDTDHDRQLMVSFRDQQEDGSWNLIERSITNNSATDSREYIFVHQAPYGELPNQGIAQDSGVAVQRQYLIWPVLRAGADYEPNTTEGTLAINIETSKQFRSNSTVLSDAYGEFNGRNGFSNDEFSNNQGHHPDQHGIYIAVDNELQQRFRLITTNDGGVYHTKSSTDPGTGEGDFIYSGYGYNTTQFYSADKMPGQDRYIGGMQDNSTWFTRAGQPTDGPASFQFAMGGDGFEALWNNQTPSEMIGSIQYNSFRRSEDGGSTWTSATSGLSGGGPFISRLANSRALPNRIFTVNQKGAAYSNDFGRSWTEVPISNLWSFSNSIDIEVSQRDPNDVLAGGFLDEDRRLHYSTDGGQTYQPTGYYQDVEMGACSGFAWDPVDDGTMYALFSFARRPKVLKSTDFGRSWEDLSGYDGVSSVSSRGFPDVAVECILIFPYDNDRIWVGSEIGIIESLDAGLSWQLLESNLPATFVHDLKIQDDEIVVATYGRGIWSVEVPAVERTYLFPPSIMDAASGPLGELSVRYDVPNDFDSIQISIDGVLVSTELQEVTKGNKQVSFDAVGLSEGQYTVSITGYRDGAQTVSLPYEVYYIAARAPVATYLNDFTTTQQEEDFYGEDFSVYLASGFADRCLHSPHVYEDQKDITHQLRIPIIVSDQQRFEYRDVAIIETGESGSSYPESDFYDYVIVEGSKDGINWEPLLDGYDASFNSTWLSTYDSKGNGNGSMFVDHSIDLRDIFEVGDIVYIRFRLSADPAANGWGWAIDDVEALLTTPVLDPSAELVKVYPNPTSDLLHLDLPAQARIKKMIITDLSGKLILQKDVSGVNYMRQDLSHFQDGWYHVLLYDEQGRLTFTERILRIN